MSDKVVGTIYNWKIIEVEDNFDDMELRLPKSVIETIQQMQGTIDRQSAEINKLNKEIMFGK